MVPYRQEAIHVRRPRQIQQRVERESWCMLPRVDIPCIIDEAGFLRLDAQGANDERRRRGRYWAESAHTAVAHPGSDFPANEGKEGSVVEARPVRDDPGRWAARPVPVGVPREAAAERDSEIVVGDAVLEPRPDKGPVRVPREDGIPCSEAVR